MSGITSYSCINIIKKQSSFHVLLENIRLCTLNKYCLVHAIVNFDHLTI